MSPEYLYYRVVPNENLPAGLSPILLTVLSPVWQGPSVMLEYPDGWQQTLIGWTADGFPGDLKIFWTQAAEGGLTVCLAIGGDGVRLSDMADFDIPISPDPPHGEGRPFLALAESLIPAAVAAVIGPVPERAPLMLI
jgi:hypothetical protein